MVFNALDIWVLAGVGMVAGLLGALLGLGGGILVIPVLVLGFGVPIHMAVATGLVSVLATSSAAGSVYVGEGLTNMRVAMTLLGFSIIGYFFYRVLFHLRRARPERRESISCAPSPAALTLGKESYIPVFRSGVPLRTRTRQI